MINITIYNIETGQIKWNVQCQSDLADKQCELGETWRLGTIDKHIEYIDVETGENILRPPNPSVINNSQVISDGIEEIIASNLPIPCTIIVTGPITGIIDLIVGDPESLPLTFDIPGTYTIRVMSFPYLDKEFTIEAT